MVETAAARRLTSVSGWMSLMEFIEKVRLMDAAAMQRALARMASEIVERNRGAENLVIAGIRRRGVPLAERIADAIEKLEGVRPQLGVLDITLYRDDLSLVAPKPVVNATAMPGQLASTTVVIVDDVLYTGRTIRAALDALFDLGRPRRVQLAVLIDRGHREVPIQADFVGERIPTKATEIVKVMVAEIDGAEQVLIVEPAATGGGEPAAQ
ncbi:MAG: bifunctional pyr operon transcriptional regulator/uracil phosphoribosyltransferase PyrR [Chloracidobacterium sp.]|nr:bifunctional pyr operon transcriptional regulator/uracil phosphoribosyltransferase PyrR [Chloracidobacterium sp.]MDW8216574.1 bifunctional pyr operon transcriptional regulator/uracil phosphoribosyltransferase PyrR [Acidobacteriota bacterium]